jgi:hypothetical protein
MWIRKTNSQLASERNRIWLSFGGPAVLFFICVICNLIIVIRGPLDGGNHARWPSTWSEALGISFFVGTFGAVIGYVLQIVFRKKLASLITYGKIVICSKCHRVKYLDQETTCECGGTFENFDNWTWVDEDRRADD